MPKMKTHKGASKRLKFTGTGKSGDAKLIRATFSYPNHRNKSVVCVRALLLIPPMKNGFVSYCLTKRSK